MVTVVGTKCGRGKETHFSEDIRNFVFVFVPSYWLGADKILFPGEWQWSGCQLLFNP